MRGRAAKLGRPFELGSLCRSGRRQPIFVGTGCGHHCCSVATSKLLTRPRVDQAGRNIASAPRTPYQDGNANCLTDAIPSTAFDRSTDRADPVVTASPSTGTQDDTLPSCASAACPGTVANTRAPTLPNADPIATNTCASHHNLSHPT